MSETNHPKPKHATLGALIAMNALAALFSKEHPYTVTDAPPNGLGKLGSHDGIRRAHLRAIKYRRARGGAR